MVNRRQFLGGMSLPVGASAFPGMMLPGHMGRALAAVSELGSTAGTPTQIAHDEDFWFEVRGAFTPDNSLINLQSGGVSPSPKVVAGSLQRYLAYSNTTPTYTMWEVLEPQEENVRERLARQWDVDAEEVAIVRGASEGLQICHAASTWIRATRC